MKLERLSNEDWAKVDMIIRLGFYGSLPYINLPSLFIDLYALLWIINNSNVITLQYMRYKQQPQRLGKDNSINESSLELEYFISFEQ